MGVHGGRVVDEEDEFAVGEERDGGEEFVCGGALGSAAAEEGFAAFLGLLDVESGFDGEWGAGWAVGGAGVAFWAHGDDGAGGGEGRIAVDAGHVACGGG